MDKAKNAKLFMKMARYDCMILTVLNAAKWVVTAAVVINTALSSAYIVSKLRQ